MDEGKSGSGLLVGTGLGGLGGGQIECLGLGDQIVEIGGLQRAGLLEDDLALLGNHQRRHSLNAGSLSQIDRRRGRQAASSVRPSPQVSYERASRRFAHQRANQDSCTARFQQLRQA